MYPLDRGLWGATTRITQLRDELKRLVSLDVISGTRSARAWSLLRYAASHRMSRLSGIYVENASTLPGPADLAFLGLARSLGVPVLTYVRDAQQLFAEYRLTNSLKHGLARRAFLPATRALMGVSSTVAFPSRGLARAIHGDDRPAVLLPPGARLATPVPIQPDARALLFVGPMKWAAHGSELLLDSVRLARDRGADVELICVSRRGEEVSGRLPPWVRVERAEGAAIDQLLPGVLASITPRKKTPYNDLAVPIKVLEYLGYGRPLIVTDTEETVALLSGSDCGIISQDNPEALADAIARVAAASLEQRIAWGSTARLLAERNSWQVRARRILDLLRIRTAAP